MNKHTSLHLNSISFNNEVYTVIVIKYIFKVVLSDLKLS